MRGLPMTHSAVQRFSAGLLEERLLNVLGAPFGSADKEYAVGWRLSENVSIVVDRRKGVARLYVPGGGDLSELHGLIRAVKSPGSKVSTLCNPYPGFRTRGRVELSIEDDVALVSVIRYLKTLPGCGVPIPQELAHATQQPRCTPLFAPVDCINEAELHAQLVSFWPRIEQFHGWNLCDTELSLESGRADLAARAADGSGRYLIVELKIVPEDRYVVGQIIDYMADLTIESGVDPNSIEGVILCPTPTLHLRRMADMIPRVRLLPREELRIR
jgi:hypothetical protein